MEKLNIGEKIKKHREMQGITQSELGRLLSVSNRAVSKWENGDALPSIEYLPKLAECLDCDINAFFTPIQEKTIDKNVLYDFFVLMNGSFLNVPQHNINKRSATTTKSVAQSFPPKRSTK